MIRTLSAIDDLTRESFAIEADTSLPRNRGVTSVLEAIAGKRAYAQAIDMDNGTELTRLAVLA